MEELRKRIERLEKKFDNNEKITNQNVIKIDNLKEIIKEIPEIKNMLQKLITLQEGKEKDYRLHVADCETHFDDRYVRQEGFRRCVIDILQTLRDEDLDKKNTSLSIIWKIVNIFFKIATPVGIIFLAYLNMGG